MHDEKETAGEDLTKQVLHLDIWLPIQLTQPRYLHEAIHKENKRHATRRKWADTFAEEINAKKTELLATARVNREQL